MIGQYLSNTNENATIRILQKKFGTKQDLSVLDWVRKKILIAPLLVHFWIRHYARTVKVELGYAAGWGLRPY